MTETQTRRKRLLRLVEYDWVRIKKDTPGGRKKRPAKLVEKER